MFYFIQKRQMLENSRAFKETVNLTVKRGAVFSSRDEFYGRKRKHTKNQHEIIASLIIIFRTLDCNINNKIYYLHLTVDHSPEILIL